MDYKEIGDTIILRVDPGNEKMEVKGGHLDRAIVSGTAEIFINIIAKTTRGLDRKKSPETGINELRFN